MEYVCYLRVNGALADQVFSELSEEIIIVKNNGGLAYLPAWGYNGIGDLLPGQGYQLKINSDNDFLYNANDVAYPLNRTNDNPVIINQTSKVGFDKNIEETCTLLFLNWFGLIRFLLKMKFMYTTHKGLWWEPLKLPFQTPLLHFGEMI